MLKGFEDNRAAKLSRHVGRSGGPSECDDDYMDHKPHSLEEMRRRHASLYIEVALDMQQVPHACGVCSPEPNVAWQASFINHALVGLDNLI
jgi:hypothetical protein